LSKITGVAQATISNIESCNRTPSYLTRQRLANALGYPVEEIFPDEEDLGSKKRRQQRKVRTEESAIADILLVNSTQNQSSSLQRKDEAPKKSPETVEDDKVIGFVFNTSGEKLRFFPVRIFKGKEFVDVACTDATGKFVFSGLKAGRYTLSTEGKTIEFRVKG
jgi:transcriptional regulator with XRE-family HTH domain